jgi:hypothetical protein
MWSMFISLNLLSKYAGQCLKLHSLATGLNSLVACSPYLLRDSGPMWRCISGSPAAQLRRSPRCRIPIRLGRNIKGEVISSFFGSEQIKDG